MPTQSRLFPVQGMGKRVSSMQYADPGNRGFVTLTKETFDALDDYASWCSNVARNKLPEADNYIAMALAMLSGAHAQKYSAGMRRDPNDSSRSWAMPVPRVTERYFLSWRVQKISNGAWLMTNDSREAYFIEYGIHRNPATGQVAPRRIKRPIFKLSMLRTLEDARSTNLGHRVWTDVLVPRPGEPGRRTRQLVWLSQPSGVMGEVPTFVAATPHGPLTTARLQTYRRPRRFSTRGADRRGYFVHYNQQ